MLEQAFRWPLQMPGHHGLEAMALLVLGRLCCTNPWSATLVGATAAVAAPFTGADHGVLMPLFYVLPGLVLDLGYRLWPRPGGRPCCCCRCSRRSPSPPSPSCAYLRTRLFGMQFGSLRAGPVYPIVTHLLFGFLGALAAVLVWRATERHLRR